VSAGAETIASLQAVIGADTTDFTSALDNVSKQLGGLGGLLGGLSFAGLLGGSIAAASEEQTSLAQLDAALKSTSANTGAATTEVGHWATTTEATGAKADKWREQLEMLNAKLSDNEARLAKAKGPHAALQATITAEQEQIAKLTGELGINTAGQRVWVDGTAAVAGVTHMSRDALIQMADALSQTTRFSKDTVLNGEALMLTFRKVGADTFPQATQAVLDMSQAMGYDLKNTTIMVGKALEDPLKGIGALSRVGVTFDAVQRQQIKSFMAVNDLAGAQGIILKELNTEFGGSAVAAGQTFAGQLDILHHSLDEILVSIGDQILPILQWFVQGIGDIISSLQSADPGFLTFAGVVMLVAGAIGVIPALLGAIGAVLAVITSPIGLIVAAVLGLKLAFDTNFLGIRDTVTNIFNQIKPIIQGIIDFIGSVVGILNGTATQTITVAASSAKRGGRQFGDEGQSDDPAPTRQVKVPVAGQDFGDRLGAVIAMAGPKILGAVKDLINGAWQWIQTNGPKLFGDAIKIALDVGKDIIHIAGDLVTNIRDWLQGAIQWLHDNGPALVQAAITKLLDLGQTIGDAAGTFLTSVKGFPQQALDWLGKEAVKLFSDAIAGVFGVDPSVVTDAINKVVGPISATFKTIFGQGGILSDIFDWFKNNIWNPIFGTDGIISKVAGALSTAFRDVVQIITQPFKDAIKIIANLLMKASMAGGAFAGLANIASALYAAVEGPAPVIAGGDLAIQQAANNSGFHAGAQIDPGTYAIPDSAQRVVGGGGKSGGNSAQTVHIHGDLHFHGVQDVAAMYNALQKEVGYRNATALGPA
jgi:phage-related protein